MENEAANCSNIGIVLVMMLGLVGVSIAVAGTVVATSVVVDVFGKIMTALATLAAIAIVLLLLKYVWNLVRINAHRITVNKIFGDNQDDIDVRAIDREMSYSSEYRDFTTDFKLASCRLGSKNVEYKFELQFKYKHESGKEVVVSRDYDYTCIDIVESPEDAYIIIRNTDTFVKWAKKYEDTRSVRKIALTIDEVKKLEKQYNEICEKYVNK